MEVKEDDKRVGIVVTLGALGLFIYPWVIVAGVIALGIPFGLLWLKRRYYV
jgi:hypothetical protein